LPQTQCELCGYKGCRPYAEAMVQGKAEINLCLPGGIKTLQALGEAMHRDPTPFVKEMGAKQKWPSVAVIREEECIGCMKCIQVCPVDAIIGGAKQMHTVLTDECTGCDLCLEPCPVDCIDVISLPSFSPYEEEKRREQFLERFTAREDRQVRLEAEKKSKHEQAKLSKIPLKTTSVAARQEVIQAALARVKAKKDSHGHKKD